MKKLLLWLKQRKLRIVILPESGEHGVIPKEITLKTLFKFGTGGSLLVLILLLFVLFNPYPGILSNLFFEEDRATVESLTDKVREMSLEIEEMRKMNRNLIRALNLADTTLQLKNADTSGNAAENIQGNIGAVVYRLLNLKNASANFHIERATILLRPVGGLITRGFKPENGHFGIDFGVAVGTPIAASASGMVLFSDYAVDDGHTIILLHPESFITVYKHCSKLLFEVGNRVQQGEIIALSGNSGEKSYGAHLHFELWKNERPVDPKIYLEGL